MQGERKNTILLFRFGWIYVSGFKPWFSLKTCDYFKSYHAVRLITSLCNFFPKILSLRLLASRHQPDLNILPQMQKCLQYLLFLFSTKKRTYLYIQARNWRMYLHKCMPLRPGYAVSSVYCAKHAIDKI